MKLRLPWICGASLALLGMDMACTSSSVVGPSSLGSIGSIIVAPKSFTMRIASTLQLSDTVKDAAGKLLKGQAVTWTTDSAGVASVDSNGLVTARSQGTAHVTAAAGGKSAQAAITVTQDPVSSATIAQGAPTVVVGQTTQLSVVLKDSAGNVLAGAPVRWSSQSPTVATIDSVSGIATGVAAGTSQIVATSEGVSAKTTLTVIAASANAVVLSPAVAQAHVGKTTTFVATVTDGNGKPIANPTVTFSSSATKVASITSQHGDSAQVLAGPGTGTATITGTSQGHTGTASLTVGAVGTDSVHVSAPHTTLTAGQSEALTATAFDSSGHTIGGGAVKWSSASTAVATVASNGQVTAVSPGTASIFAQIGGVTGSIALTVKAGSGSNEPASISLQVSPDSTVAIPTPLDVVVQVTATVKTASGQVLNNYPVVFTSTDPPVSGFLGMGADTVVGGSITVAPDANGRAVITATAGKVSTRETLTICYQASTPICNPLASIQVKPPVDTLTQGDSVAMEAVGIDSSGKAYPNMFVEWDPGNVVSSDSSRVIVVEPNGEVDGLNLGTQFVSGGISGEFSGQGEITVIPAGPGMLMAGTPGYEERRARLIASVQLARQRAVDERNRRIERVRQQLLSAMSGVRDPSTVRTYRRILARIDARAHAPLRATNEK